MLDTVLSVRGKRCHAWWRLTLWRCWKNSFFFQPPSQFQLLNDKRTKYVSCAMKLCSGHDSRPLRVHARAPLVENVDISCSQCPGRRIWCFTGKDRSTCAAGSISWCINDRAWRFYDESINYCWVNGRLSLDAECAGRDSSASALALKNITLNSPHRSI